jgi:outer membrane protein OmpA-like peptidoglycan-associated protein
LFYAIRDSEIDPESIIRAAAAWCKKYPNKTINVSGYADKGTGNAKLNMMYSQQRTNKVVDMLKKKGVPESQIKSAAYGDTVQPYSENDKNRCVIIEGN